jgi:hypothetical protein
MSWKNRYTFPSLEELNGKKVMMKKDIEFTGWDKSVVDTHYGKTYTCDYMEANKFHLNRPNQTHKWSCGYNFIKKFFDIVEE